MTATPLSLHRVLPDPALVQAVERILATVPGSTTQEHGITVRPNKKDTVRALVFWGDFGPDGDALAKRIRDTLGDKYQVSQCRSPETWGKFRTATEENPYDY